MSVFFETLVIGGVVSAGGALITAALYPFYRRSFMMRLWISLVPGFVITGMSTYVNAKLGGVQNVVLLIPQAFLTTGIVMVNVLLVGRTIMRRLEVVAAGLEHTAAEVGSTTDQIASSSQQLAANTNEQASSLQEVTGSLEEVTVTIRRNAERATQARSMSDQANSAVSEGQGAVAQMSEAFDRIRRSTDDTAKIIKAIDELAMQTNLLALNAAVEAARAGDAGRGFAVVAEEVRNLAQRSAEAARNTSSLIGESQESVAAGASASANVETALTTITARITSLADLVGDVSNASEEQAQGVGQINSAITQIDRSTQDNATNAEETASASEELSNSARGLNDIVRQLIRLIDPDSTRLASIGVARYHAATARSSGEGGAAHAASARSKRMAV